MTSACTSSSQTATSATTTTVLQPIETTTTTFPGGTVTEPQQNNQPTTTPTTPTETSRPDNAADVTDPPITTQARGGDDFGRPGAHRVGIRTYQTERGDIDVWYPAADDASGPPFTYSPLEAVERTNRSPLPSVLERDITIPAIRDAPADDGGPFPLVIHSHGFGGYRRDLGNHLRHLASWGYVVLAPDHQDRSRAGLINRRAFDGSSDVEDLRQAIALIEQLSGRGPLRGMVNLDLMAVEGHSVGVGTVLNLAAEQDSIRALIALAPVVTRSAGLAINTDQRLINLVIAADGDIAAPLETVESFYDLLDRPKRLAVLDQTGHSTFTDICGAIRARGGILDLASTIDVPIDLLRLVENGCREGDSDPIVAGRLVDHLTVAHLRLALGGIQSGIANASLSESSVGRIGGRVLESYVID